MLRENYEGLASALEVLRRRKLTLPAETQLYLQRLTQAQTAQYDAFRQRYWQQPAAFVRDCFTWRADDGPTSYQTEILQAVPQYRRVSVRGPHGLGKTALASWVILWFALTRDGEDWKAPCTASAWRQLTKFLWPEVGKWARRLRWDKIGRAPFRERTEQMALSLRLNSGEAFTLASNNSALIEGAHANHLLYVFDESKTIPPATWDSAEGAFSTGNVYWLAISTPGEPVGRFYDIQKRKPGYEDWWVRHVTLKEAEAAGRVGAQWAADRQRQWGEASAVYQNRVLGEFATSEEDGVIPLAWIEAANERWHAWHEATEQPGALTAVGVDVARSGEDKTVLALRCGAVITELRRYAKADTMETTGRVLGVLIVQPQAAALVDVIGIGAGVVDRLREQGQRNIVAFNASAGTDRRDTSGELGFTNLRSAAWWNLRELLDPANGEQVALPPDDLLTGDLTAPHWRVLSGGRIQIESKEDIKVRLGRSTDDGDAVVMAFWRPEMGNFLAHLRARQEQKP